MERSHTFATRLPLRDRLFPNHEWILLAVLAAETAIFGLIGGNFLTADNGFEIVRLGVELGLLALALTPVIVAGGIDLSVGSMMGLAAILFGKLCVTAGLSPVVAGLLVLLAGAAGGLVNAVLIAGLGIPALIVTLGTYSLYRGLAEGLTQGIENYSQFPPGFLALGQGYLPGGIPNQLPILLLAVVGFALLLHRTAFGRSLYAIGCSPDGARHAGLPATRNVAIGYLLSGLMSSLAAIIYVAHLGQAKADAGTGYELMAITAVVLGGTSIYGGRGTIGGTVLGLFAIVVLENGLRLAGLPAELAGILVGTLMIVAIGGHRLAAAPAAAKAEGEEAFDMKNSQVAVLSAVMLLSALLIAGSNLKVAGRLERLSTTPAVAPAAPATQAEVAPEPTERITVAMMPKSKGDPYFISCRQGAEEAAKELNVDLLWDGPTETDPMKQNEVVEAWITKGVDVIAVSVENQAAISTVLRKARERGITVLTWDADAEKDARDFVINQATPEGIGFTLTDQAARIMGETGRFAIVTASLTAANQNDWIKFIRQRLADQYPSMSLEVIKPSDGLLDRAVTETQNILKAYPDVKLIMAIAAPAVPGAAEAVKQSGRTDVKVIGLSLPNMCKEFIHSGIIDCIVLWNTIDLGYLTVYASRAAKTGELKPGTASFQAGRLGTVEVQDDEVLLGPPFIFSQDNVDQFDF